MGVAAPSPLPPDEMTGVPRGLPGPLPEGERILWQGSPRWTALARHALHAPLVAAYFGVLLVWRIVDGANAGETAFAVAGSLLLLAGLGLAVMALILGYAWLAARTTTYTLTDRRIVLTFGIALPMSLNLPYRSIGSAAVKLFSDGTGDIPVVVTEKRRLSWIVLWPHVRPWRFSRIQPMLRAVPDAAAVAEILSGALAEAQAVRPAPQARTVEPRMAEARDETPSSDGRLRPAAA